MSSPVDVTRAALLVSVSYQIELPEGWTLVEGFTTFRAPESNEPLIWTRFRFIRSVGGVESHFNVLDMQHKQLLLTCPIDVSSIDWDDVLDQLRQAVRLQAGREQFADPTALRFL